MSSVLGIYTLRTSRRVRTCQHCGTVVHRGEEYLAPDRTLQEQMDGDGRIHKVDPLLLEGFCSEDCAERDLYGWECNADREVDNWMGGLL